MKDSNINEKYFFEIDKTKDNLFYFNLKDKNGNICLGSLPYTLKTNCKHGIRSIIRNSKNEDRFEVEQDSFEDWFFWLKGGNGRIIAKSQEFVTKEELKNLIEDLKYLSLKAPVIDRSIVSKDIRKNKHNQRIITPPPAYLNEGLTKRAYFAGLAMHAIISNQGMLDKIGQQDIVKTSLKYADRLLDEISKTEKNMI